MEILDYKKAFKELYGPKTEASVLEVPEMKFIQVDGKGNPNETDGEYQKAMELLASYKKYPNRPVQTLVLGAPEFYADDALVQAQLRKVIHSMAGDK